MSIEVWESQMRDAVKAMLEYKPYKDSIDGCHTEGTPERVVKAFKEYFSGCLVDPPSVLSTTFAGNGHNQMVHVRKIRFYSLCAHHLAEIRGYAHFAYIPDSKIVGLSKIPRLVEVLSRRPQIQEVLTDQIVDVFMNSIQPVGCGVALTADHSCMQCRGVRSQAATTDTTALRGSFLVFESTKMEFLSAVRNSQ